MKKTIIYPFIFVLLTSVVFATVSWSTSTNSINTGDIITFTFQGTNGLYWIDMIIPSGWTIYSDPSSGSLTNGHFKTTYTGTLTLKLKAPSNSDSFTFSGEWGEGSGVHTFSSKTITVGSGGTASDDKVTGKIDSVEVDGNTVTVKYTITAGKDAKATGGMVSFETFCPSTVEALIGQQFTCYGRTSKGCKQDVQQNFAIGGTGKEESISGTLVAEDVPAGKYNLYLASVDKCYWEEPVGNNKIAPFYSGKDFTFDVTVTEKAECATAQDCVDKYGFGEYQCKNGYCIRTDAPEPEKCKKEGILWKIGKNVTEDCSIAKLVGGMAIFLGFVLLIKIIGGRR